MEVRKEDTVAVRLTLEEAVLLYDELGSHRCKWEIDDCPTIGDFWDLLGEVT